MNPASPSVRLLATVLLVSLWLLPTSAWADGPWFAEYKEAQTVAQREGKDLLIDFGGSDWCGPCQWLKTRILSRPEFSERAAK